jgi:hypothetical protein
MSKFVSLGFSRGTGRLPGLLRRKGCLCYDEVMERVSAGALLFCFGLLGCNFNDDEPLDPTIGGTGGDTDGGPNSQAECLDHATAIGVECDMGQSFWFDWNGPDYNMTLIDDPAASVGVGPNAWLLQARTSADWIGDYEGSAGDCQFGCAFCPPGQSLCHGGFDENGFPTCYLCLPVEDTPAGITAAGNACSTFVTGNQACLGGLPPGEGGGDGGTTSGGGDSGVDSTGAGAEYDCNLWDVSSAVLGRRRSPGREQTVTASSRVEGLGRARSMSQPWL